jgi:hypothetical protein
MKLTPPLIAALAVALLLLIGLVYQGIELSGANREIAEMKGTEAGLAAQMAAAQKSVDGLAAKSKQSESTQGKLQTLAKNLESGDMELAVKSIRIVADGKALVSIGSNPEQGGAIEVKSNDGASSSQITAGTGSSKMIFKSSSGADASQVVHLATLSDDGIYLQKGPTDDPATRTDGAGFRILDPGTTFFMIQSGGGNIALDTSSADERAKFSLSAEGDDKNMLSLALGTKDTGPAVSVSGGATGNTLKLVADRLTLLNHNNTVLFGAAADDNGGFEFFNDSSGARRAFVTAGADGHGSISVYGNDKRSNTLFPEYNIQQSGSTQK